MARASEFVSLPYEEPHLHLISLSVFQDLMSHWTGVEGESGRASGRTVVEEIAVSPTACKQTVQREGEGSKKTLIRGKLQEILQQEV